MARKLPSPLRYQHFAVVVALNNYSPFPIDMLRYDGCSPYKEEDSQRIIASIGSFAIPPDESLKSVIVTKYAEIADGEAAWRPDRWRSFGWGLKILKNDYNVLDQTS